MRTVVLPHCISTLPEHQDKIRPPQRGTQRFGSMAEFRRAEDEFMKQRMKMVNSQNPDITFRLTRPDAECSIEKY